MRVGLYVRVSTRDQDCGMQLRDLRTYSAARQLVVFREYVDQGQSGTKDSRPQLNTLMDDARKRKLDAVIVWRFDRFARYQTPAFRSGRIPQSGCRVHQLPGEH